MASIFAFKCTSCDEIHEGSPSFAYPAPAPYTWLTDEERENIAELSEDLCAIAYPEGAQYFIRAVLEVPIHGIEEPFLWGIWVSASEQSFQRYLDSYDKPQEDNCFFGWISNRIAIYPSEESRGADVWIQTDGTRPRVVLHHKEPMTDALAIDQREGISIARAQELAEQAMHGMNHPEK